MEAAAGLEGAEVPAGTAGGSAGGRAGAAGAAGAGRGSEEDHQGLGLDLDEDKFVAELERVLGLGLGPGKCGSMSLSVCHLYSKPAAVEALFICTTAGRPLALPLLSRRALLESAGAEARQVWSLLIVGGRCWYQ